MNLKKRIEDNPKVAIAVIVLLVLVLVSQGMTFYSIVNSYNNIYGG